METALEVNIDITKYMVMSCVQNAGRSYSIKSDNGRVQIFGEKINSSKYYSGRN